MRQCEHGGVDVEAVADVGAEGDVEAVGRVVHLAEDAVLRLQHVFE